MKNKLLIALPVVLFILATGVTFQLLRSDEGVTNTATSTADLSQTVSRATTLALSRPTTIVPSQSDNSTQPAPSSTESLPAITLASQPSTEPLHIAVAGDVGTGDFKEYATSAAMDVLDEQNNFAALLLLGDNVYENGEPDKVQEKVFDPFNPVLDKDTKLYAVLGNHDVRNGNGPAHAKALGMPNRWYSKQLNADTTLIALDSTDPGNAEQLQWLDATLAETQTRWTIAIFHHPAFSAGYHGNEPGVQQHFVPLFKKHQVDLVLTGHDHDYQRNKPQDGTLYIVTGAAAKLRDVGRKDFTEVAFSVHSFVTLTIYNDRIEGTAIDHSGQTIDTFSLNA